MARMLSASLSGTLNGVRISPVVIRFPNDRPHSAAKAAYLAIAGRDLDKRRADWSFSADGQGGYVLSLGGSSKGRLAATGRFKISAIQFDDKPAAPQSPFAGMTPRAAFKAWSSACRQVRAATFIDSAKIVGQWNGLEYRIGFSDDWGHEESWTRNGFERVNAKNRRGAFAEMLDAGRGLSGRKVRRLNVANARAYRMSNALQYIPGEPEYWLSASRGHNGRMERMREAGFALQAEEMLKRLSGFMGSDNAELAAFAREASRLLRSR